MTAWNIIGLLSSVLLLALFWRPAHDPEARRQALAELDKIRDQGTAAWATVPVGWMLRRPRVVVLLGLVTFVVGVVDLVAGVGGGG